MPKKQITNRAELRTERLSLKRQANYQRMIITEGVDNVAKLFKPLGLLAAASAAAIPFLRSPVAHIGSSVAMSAIGGIFGRKNKPQVIVTPTGTAISTGRQTSFLGGALNSVIKGTVSAVAPKVLPRLLDLLLKRR